MTIRHWQVPFEGRAPRRAAAAIAAIVTVLGVGVIVGRSLSPAGAHAEAREATAPATAGDPGPRSRVGDVPVGYARTEAGAVAAATNYLVTAAERLLPLDTHGRRAAVERMLAPDAGPGVSDDILAPLELIDAARQAAHVSSGRALVRVLPMAYHLEAFSPQRARVGVWSSGVFSIEGLTAPTETWSTTTVDLVWASDDWHMYAMAGRAGPVPAAPEPPVTPAADLLGALDGYTGYRYEPIR